MNPLSRRSALGFLGGAIAGAITSSTRAASAAFCAPPGALMWSALGLSGNVTLPSGLVVLDVDASVSTLTIPAGSTLLFHPDRSVLLESSGNVIVDGTLTARPTAASVVHTIRFVGINETNFVGGGCAPIASDVGLWVTGTLDLVGTPKQAWTRLVAPVASGVTSFVVGNAAGWRTEDALVLAPMSDPETSYSTAVAQAINGNVVTCTATQNAHPMGPTWLGAPIGAEVLNLTRNVIVEGSPTGRAHVMINSTLPQTIRYVELRHLGPRSIVGYGYKNTPIYNVTNGRYALHFHSCQDGSRGSTVEGVVAHTLGNRAFVPHASHGITFRDCVAHDGFEQLYWWDDGHTSSDITFDRCAASKVWVDRSSYRTGGFKLMGGTGNKVVDCVAFGMLGSTNASGFFWPEGDDSLWEFRGNVAHQSRNNGIFVWQNNGRPHFVSDSLAYGCDIGIRCGAYRNRYRWERITVAQCVTPVLSEALSYPTPTTESSDPQRWVDCVFHGGSVAVQGGSHTLASTVPVEFHRCTFNAVIGFVTGSVTPDMYDFVDCSFSGSAFRIDSAAATGTRLRFQNAAAATQETKTGTSAIAPFFTGTLPSGSFVRGVEKTYTYICAI